MALSLNLSFNPVWSMQDLNGLQLDDTYYMFTLLNTVPYNFSPIYQDENGITPWSDPIQFLANGSLPTNMYWNDALVYRLEIRKGNTQSDPLVYLIQNYIPNGSQEVPPVVGNNSTDNLLTNPQFVDISYQVSTLTSTENTIDFAPGWQLITTGIGSIQITQNTLAGSNDIETNPSYYISITNSGFNTVSLQQTFSKNGALWTGQAAAMSITGQASNPTNITTRLVYSDASVTLPIISTQLTSGWATSTGSISIDPSSNATTGTNAYTQLQINWTGNVTVNLTSLQLIGQDVVDTTITYAQIPVERQIDHEFHYYLPQLSSKPIPSYTIGWDFGFNPCQELGYTVGTSSLSANQARYIADQTIAFESVASSLSYAFTNTGVAISAASPTQFALIQYLDAETAVELLNNRMSAQIKGNITAGTLAGHINLYWTNAAAPVLPSSVVVALTAGIPTSIAGGWTIVNRSTLSDAVFSLGTTTNTFGFNGWDATQDAGINAATFFAIVVSFNTLSATNPINLNYISLVGGDIATAPAPLSNAQTLQALEYYYEKSYPVAVPVPVAGTPQNTLVNAKCFPLPGTGVNITTAYPGPFEILFHTIKRSVIPTVIIYNPTNSVVNNVLVNVWGRSITPAYSIGTGSWPLTTTNWVVESNGSRSISYVPAAQLNPLTTGNGISGTYVIAVGTLILHYSSDARIGIVV